MVSDALKIPARNRLAACPPIWRQGLTTEAARAALRFGLIDQGLERIGSTTQVGNDDIMHKLGMRLERGDCRSLV